MSGNVGNSVGFEFLFIFRGFGNKVLFSKIPAYDSHLNSHSLFVEVGILFWRIPTST